MSLLFIETMTNLWTKVCSLYSERNWDWGVQWFPNDNEWQSWSCNSLSGSQPGATAFFQGTTCFSGRGIHKQSTKQFIFCQPCLKNCISLQSNWVSGKQFTRLFICLCLRTFTFQYVPRKDDSPSAFLWQRVNWSIVFMPEKISSRALLTFNINNCLRSWSFSGPLQACPSESWLWPLFWHTHFRTHTLSTFWTSLSWIACHLFCMFNKNVICMRQINYLWLPRSLNNIESCFFLEFTKTLFKLFVL